MEERQYSTVLKSARLQFVLLPTEIHLLIAGNLKPTSILKLSLTCRSLNRTVFPLFYKHVDLHSSLKGNILSTKSLFDGLHALGTMNGEEKLWVRHVVIAAPHSVIHCFTSAESLGTQIIKALEGCDSLQSIELELVEILISTIDQVKKLPRLQKLSITYPGKRDWAPAIFDNADSFFQGFKNLTSLRIHRLRCCLNPHLRTLPAVLVASPNLTDLRLSIYGSELRGWDDGSRCHHFTDETLLDYHRDFWMQICICYVDSANGHRLSLKSLHLGEGTFLELPAGYGESAAESELDNYMTRALDLAALTSFTFTPLTLDRCPHTHGRGKDETLVSNSRIFLLETASNITQLAVNRLSVDITNFLTSRKQSLTHLRIDICKYFSYNDGSEDAQTNNEREAWIQLWHSPVLNGTLVTVEKILLPELFVGIRRGGKERLSSEASSHSESILREFDSLSIIILEKWLCLAFP